jgi:serine/threonine-protein kinase RsbW
VLKKIQLQLHSDLTASCDLLSWFEQLNEPPIADKMIWWQCQTLLQEGFTNIVEHAHKELPPQTPIDIEVVRFEQSIEIRLWSYGPPFDIKQKLQELPDFEDNESGRGRGWKIISQIADQFSYEQVEKGRQCLLMLKRY